jgi:hypothetical protein
MSTPVLGSQSYSITPDVNGIPVLLGINTPVVQSDVLANRPVPGNIGNLFISTDTNVMYRDGGTQWNQLSTGHILQQVFGNIPAQIGTTQTLYGNTAPTISQGFQIWSTSFTPISSTSTILIMFNLMLDDNYNSRQITTTVFGGNSTLLGSTSVYLTTAGKPVNTSIIRAHNPGSTSTIIYSARVGANGSGIVYVNQGLTATLGGSAASSFTIFEFI